MRLDLTVRPSLGCLPCMVYRSIKHHLYPLSVKRCKLDDCAGVDWALRGLCATPARAGASGPARQGCLHVQGRAGHQPAVSLYALSTRQPVVSMQQTHYDCNVLPRAETQGCKPYSGYKHQNFFSHTMYSSADLFSRCDTIMFGVLYHLVSFSCFSHF